MVQLPGLSGSVPSLSELSYSKGSGVGAECTNKGCALQIAGSKVGQANVSATKGAVDQLCALEVCLHEQGVAKISPGGGHTDEFGVSHVGSDERCVIEDRFIQGGLVQAGTVKPGAGGIDALERRMRQIGAFEDCVAA